MRWLALVLAGSALACGGSNDGGGGSGGGCPNPTLTDLQQQIFLPSCANSDSCHNTVGHSANLILAASAVCTNLKNVASCEAPSKKRAAPGNSAASYIIDKLTCPTDFCSAIPAPSCGQTESRRMPSLSLPLSSCKIDAVRRWIDMGMPGC